MCICFETYVFTDHGLVNVKSKKNCEGTFLRFCNGYCVRGTSRDLENKK